MASLLFSHTLGRCDTKFRELTDRQWRFIKPLLPPKAKEGRPRNDDRQTINGILYVLTTGCRWMELPKEYGPKSTVHDRLKDWEKLGVWKKIMDAIVSSNYLHGKLSPDEVAIDSTDVPAIKGGEEIGYDGNKDVLGTKIHAIVTGDSSLPINVILGPANEHECRKLFSLIDLRS